MEVIDTDFRHRSPEDESTITMLHYDGNMLQHDLKNARYAFIGLMIVNVIGMIMGFYKHTVEDVLLEGLFLLAMYGFCAWYVGRNPKVAMLIGVSVYLLQIVVYAILVPATLAQGIILKIALIYYLAKGLNAAFKFEKVQAGLLAYGEELTIRI